MNIGFDIHGVIDTDPSFYSMLINKIHDDGHIIHIITGQEQAKVQDFLHDNEIYFDHFYSIVDYHKKINTPMYTRSDKNGWWMDGKLWRRSKGDYALYVELDIHIDDYYGYAEYFPPTCTYIVLAENGMDRLRGMFF